MIPLKWHSAVEWTSREPVHWKAQRPMVDIKHMRNIWEAILQSDVQIGELDLWQGYISAPLSALNFGERLVDLSVIFGQLRCLTIEVAK